MKIRVSILEMVLTSTKDNNLMRQGKEPSLMNSILVVSNQGSRNQNLLKESPNMPSILKILTKMLILISISHSSYL
jgi:hypothetical protein